MAKKVENKCDCNCIHRDKLDRAIGCLKSFNSFCRLSEFYKNFSDETRLKILTILDNVESMCVCDIAVALDMTKSAISHQLKLLKDDNLVKSSRSGKIVYYSLSDDHVKEILECGLEHIKEGCNE
ncbi:MAG: helix-turn-helix transcriptional regulator [Clostridia bacterium]|nr:helix-turn-helix transcriptional regulator [Clostridia bacterium]